jgi:hypothetical protein
MVLEGSAAQWGRIGQARTGEWSIEWIGVCSCWQRGELSAKVACEVGTSEVDRILILVVKVDLEFSLAIEE